MPLSERSNEPTTTIAPIQSSLEPRRVTKPAKVVIRTLRSPSPELIYASVTRVPVELWSRIFEYYVVIDGKVQVVMRVCKRWRFIALTTPKLWRRILICIDGISPSLRTGSTHSVCTMKGLQTILSRARQSPLEITLVLGPPSSDSPPAHARAELFKGVGSLDPNAWQRITFLCLIFNPHMTLEVIIPSFRGVFNAEFPALESLMIASALKLARLYDALAPLLRRISATSKGLRSIYLENIDQPFIAAASKMAFWSKLTRITVRGHLEAVDVRAFSVCLNLEFLSYSSELMLPSQDAAAMNAMELPFPQLKWFKVNAIAMYTLERMHIPLAHTIVIETVLGNYPNPVPAPHTLVYPTLKVLHLATVNATPACISAPSIETLCLSIPTVKRADADHVLNAMFDGQPGMMQPKHLTLNAPVHDKHLRSALKNLPNLLSLQLDHQAALTNGFFLAMTPATRKARGFKQILMDWIALTKAQSEEESQAETNPPSAAASTETQAPTTATAPAQQQVTNPSTATRPQPQPPQPFLLPFLKCLVLDLQSSDRTPEECREKAVKMMDARKEAGAPLERFSCKFKKDEPAEEFIRPALCLSCIENKANGGTGNVHGHGAGHGHGS